jgi:hypothetical protein
MNRIVYDSEGPACMFGHILGCKFDFEFDIPFFDCQLALFFGSEIAQTRKLLEPLLGLHAINARAGRVPKHPRPGAST